MTGSATSRTNGRTKSVDARRVARSARVAGGGRLERLAVMASAVGLWMGLGWALNLGSVAYLLAGIPLTIAFQLLVARRPIRDLWLLDSRRFRLDRFGLVIAIGLAALPLYATALGIAGARVLDVGYGLAGVVGAAPAAFALRAMDGRSRRALLRSIRTAGLVAAALFLLNRVASDGPAMADPLAAARAFAISLLLYIPMVFVIEEVFFRGALDTWARGPGRTDDVASAIVVSLLWGFWHLPLVLAEGGLATLPITLAFHLVVGLLLTLPWRRSGNLAVPGLTHALIDAVRDGLAAA